MLYRYTYHGGVWVDLENPTEDEVRSIVKEFSIDERLEAELLSPTPTSIVASGANMTFLVLHFPAHDSIHGNSHDQEIDLIVSNDFMITTHYEVIEPLHRLQKLLETQQIVMARDTITTDVLLEIIFTHLYTSVRDHINHSVDQLAHVEQNMFNGHERSTVHDLSNISREFLHIDASLARQEDPLDTFLKALVAHGSFGASFAERADRIRTERSQIAQLSATHRAVAIELRETNTALLGARQNEIMKTLTIVNFIFLPLGLISWIFAMRTEGMPLIDSPNAFSIVLAIMLGIALLLTLFFAKKRWL